MLSERTWFWDDVRRYFWSRKPSTNSITNTRQTDREGPTESKQGSPIVHLPRGAHRLWDLSLRKNACAFQCRLQIVWERFAMPCPKIKLLWIARCSRYLRQLCHQVLQWTWKPQADTTDTAPRLSLISHQSIFSVDTVDGWNPAPPAMSCMIASLMLPPATPIISKLGWHPRWCRISAIQNCLLFLDLSSCNVNIQGVRGKPFSCKVVQDFGHQQYHDIKWSNLQVIYMSTWLHCFHMHGWNQYRYIYIMYFNIY